MATHGTAGTWLRTARPVSQARVNLVFLPHAGGSASYYREWGGLLPRHIGVHVLQYPGREDRLSEPCLDDMAVLADAVTEVIRPLLDTPTVLFGHSMGASLMYEVTRRCERAGSAPALLIASGHPAPHRRDPGTLHQSSDDELVAELCRFSDDIGVLLGSPELRELMLPVVRADYKLIETYRLPEPVPVRTPLAVLRGADDPDVTADTADSWRDLTVTGELRRHRVFSGGHFYVREDREALLRELADLADSVDPAAVPRKGAFQRGS